MECYRFSSFRYNADLHITDFDPVRTLTIEAIANVYIGISFLITYLEGGKGGWNTDESSRNARQQVDAKKIGKISFSLCGNKSRKYNQ